MIFIKIINHINSNQNKKLKYYKNINANIITNIFDIYDKKYQLQYNFKNLDEFFNYTFYRVVYNLNKHLFYFFNDVIENDIMNDSSKKNKNNYIIF